LSTARYAMADKPSACPPYGTGDHCQGRWIASKLAPTSTETQTQPSGRYANNR